MKRLPDFGFISAKELLPPDGAERARDAISVLRRRIATGVGAVLLGDLAQRCSTRSIPPSPRCDAVDAQRFGRRRLPDQTLGARRARFRHPASRPRSTPHERRKVRSSR